MTDARICFVTSAPLTLHAFMRNNLVSLSRRCEVLAVANFSFGDLSNEWLPGCGEPLFLSSDKSASASRLAGIDGLVSLFSFRSFRCRTFGHAQSKASGHECGKAGGRPPDLMLNYHNQKIIFNRVFH